MKTAILLFCVVVGFSTESVRSQEAISETEWDLVLQRSIIDQAQRYARALHNRRQAVKSAKELKGYRSHVRQNLLKALYDDEKQSSDEKSALPVKYVGKEIQHDQYRIQNLSFESIPGFWVTANLYIPNRNDFPVPGIVCIADHATDGKAAPYNQRQGIAFAERGFVALVIDSPDRGELTKGNDHFVNGAQVALTGLWSNYLFIANAIRAIDFMVSRDDLVISDSIGITGTSGGGASAAVTAAIDCRISAAVTCCWVEPFDRAVASGYTFCPEYFAPGGLISQLEATDIMSLIIPRPHLPISALDDGLFSQNGFDESVDEVQSFYRLAGLREKFRVVRTREEHTYSAAMREAAYYWFCEWLGTPNSEQLPTWEDRVREPTDVRFTLKNDQTALESVSDLCVGSQCDTSLCSIARSRGTRLRSKRYSFEAANFSVDKAAVIRDRVRAFFDSSGNVSTKSPLVHRLSSLETHNSVAEEIVLQSQQGTKIPAKWLHPTKSKMIGSVLYINDRGYEQIDKLELREILALGYAILAVDLRGMGKLYPRASAWDRYEWCDISRALSYGLWTMNSSVPHLQISDAKMCMSFLMSNSSSTELPIYVVGRGYGAPIALFLAAISDRVAGVIGHGSLISYFNYLEHPLPTVNLMGLSYGLLKKFDIPVVLASVADRILYWGGPVSATGKSVSEDQLLQIYKLPRALVTNPDKVFSSDPNEEFCVAEVLEMSE